MKKVLVNIKSDSLMFSLRIRSSKNSESIMNTNIISHNELVFSDEYILSNLEIVSLFIKDLCFDKKITKIIVLEMEILPIVLKMVDKLPVISNILILEETNFTYSNYELIINNGRVKSLDCYSMPTFMIELFDQKGIKVKSHGEILFTSLFMQDNHLERYSKIYYKKIITFGEETKEADLTDFDTFCHINRYLKIININKCNLDLIDKIIAILDKNDIKNIKLNIHADINDVNLVTELRKRNKEYRKQKIILKLVYSKEYVKKNLVKQLILTIIMYCAGIVLIIIGGAFLYVIYNNQISEKNVSQIQNDIKEVISSNQKNKTDVTEENKETNNEATDDNEKLPQRVLSKDMATLLYLNKDTVGWLTVPGTKIDYPVVRGQDNSYYLNHNYYQEYDYNGWVFMNYLNNPKYLDRNTILFAHNRYYSGVMFGTLSKINNEDWFNKADSNLITFNTLYENMEWEVFSIYSIDVTSDYIKTSFKDDQEWLDFIKLIRDRSSYQNDIVIGKDDKIITLSTCLDNDQRLVVHAVLKK